MFAGARVACAGGVLLAALGLPGCGPAEDRGAAPDEAPLAIADHAGAVCGMLVRDQPAPRAQVLHRDGTTLFVCSLGDLLVHLAAPSPHGRARRVLVEVLAPDEDPLEPSSEPHPWLDARFASYVVGVPRPRSMGPPILAYADRTSASRVALAHDGAQVLDFDGLQQWWAERR